MPASAGNLFADLPHLERGETFQELLRCGLGPQRGRGQVRIERIVSSATPEQVLYDQEHAEWVLLLQGRARLWVDGVARELVPGDYLLIPAHTLHRVMETSAQPPCIWLAVHLEGG